MYSFICIFFPSFITLFISKKMLKKNYDLESIIEYGIYCLINNALTLVFFFLVFKSDYNIINLINIYPLMMAKYALVSAVFAIIIGVSSVCIKRNAWFNIEVKGS